MPRILIVYASRHGSTAEIARFMADALRTAGAEVDVALARAAPPARGYDAYLVGAPLYFHLWERDAARYVKRSWAELSRKPFAAFAVGLTTLDPSPEARELAEACVRASLDREGADLRPDALAIFNGAIHPADHAWPVRLLLRLGRFPRGDHRDWEAIRAWTVGLGFHRGPPPEPVQPAPPP